MPCAIITITITITIIITIITITDDHHHDDDEEEEGGATKEAPEDDAAPKSTFKVDEIIPIVDSILEQDDKVSLSFFCNR